MICPLLRVNSPTEGKVLNLSLGTIEEGNQMLFNSQKNTHPLDLRNSHWLESETKAQENASE